jgi:hypothetical protein
MADDVLTKVEKQMEGTNLALAAVAEVLQKMDARLSTDEEVQVRKEEEAQVQFERTALVKEIAGEVALLLADAGLDVDGTKVRSAAKTGKAAGNADDAEKAVNIKSAIADQQATIQAMRKEGDEEEEEELDTKGYKAEKGGYMKTHVPGHEEDEDEEPVEEGMEKEGDDAEEYPAEEEEDEDGEITAMAKQLKSMRKQIANQQKTMEKAITKETESRLRKMGFREENGLQRPQMITSPLGTDGATPIKKTDSVDTVDQLAALSYKQLRDLQAQIEMGNTEGVPKELLGG